MATTTTTTLKKRFIAPALPQPTQNFDVAYFQQFNNVLRLYFNQLDTLLGQLVSVINDGSGITFPYGAFHQDGNTTLSSGITNVSTTPISVASTSGFPSSGYILIGSEIIQFTGITTTTFTGITRGALGTTNVAHTAGAAVTEAQGTGSPTTIGTVLFNTTDFSNGVSVDPANNANLVFSKTGIYNLQFSAQLLNFTTSEDNVTFWLSQNGTDVEYSAGIEQVNSKHGSAPGAKIAAWNYLLEITSGDYITLKWASDSGNTVVATYPAGTSPTHPVSPALIFTATFVSAP